MKTYRMEFQRGINIVGDKAVIRPGFVDVAENVDLRSGMPRAVKAPEFVATAHITSTKIFEYRGKWYYSQRWRDYQAEYINGRDRIYFTESGEVASTATLVSPSKIIDGTEVLLGTPRPKVAPYVSSTNLLTPIVSSSITISSITVTGNYNKSQSTSFRLAMRDVNGIHTPSSPIYNQFVTDGSLVTYEWPPIAGAIGYNVFIGTLQGYEQKVTELGAAATMYRDTGVYQGTGEFASNYDSKASYSYFYTFLRDVNTVQDESAPSDLSTALETTKTRRVVFDVLNDGFYSQVNAQYSVGGITITPSASYAGTVAITAYNYNPNRVQTQVVTTSAHGIKTGEYAYFSGVGDSRWDGQILQVIADTSSATSLYIKNIHNPSGTVIVGTISYPATIFGGMITKAKSFVSISPAPTLSTINGDAVYINISNSIDPSRVFAATASATGQFEINAYTAVGATASIVKYVPGNGKIKYRNLYRIGDTDQYSLVERVPVTKDRWIDGATFEYIDGTPPDSYYVEDGKTIIYEPPPKGMVGLTLHYGMMFGIDGHTLRWTPTGRPDAWPSVLSLKFPFKPLALHSWGQSLTILCMDGIYRLDGNIPTQMSLSQTQSGDGCIAPHSVQKTQAGLVYLSRRGIMLFNGSKSECITDLRIPSGFFTSPSYAATVNYAWQPTLRGYNYANLAHADGIGGIVSGSNNLYNTTDIAGPIYDIKSFFHLGKYYLYWAKQGASSNSAAPSQPVDYSISLYGATSLTVTSSPVTLTFYISISPSPVEGVVTTYAWNPSLSGAGTITYSSITGVSIETYFVSSEPGVSVLTMPCTVTIEPYDPRLVSRSITITRA